MWRSTVVKSFSWRIDGLQIISRFHGSCSRGACDKTWVLPTGFDTGLKTFNSLTKRKEPLILAREGVATWYSCGPTVYDHAHLGHACSYVRFDVLQRILSKVFGITVIHAMVITDIDDKIITRGWEEKISPTIIARMYEEEFKKDMISLKVIPPAAYLRVTENVPQIVAFIQRIIEHGKAYATKEGDVYFDIQSIGRRYGKFGGAVDSQEGVGSSSKKDVRDFALWKRAKPHQPYWESPWGPGRPGWHIECSTIASSVFGSQLDIHSGGVDLAFPHHENEVAQSEAYHQCDQWSNYFLHSGHLHLKGDATKMSKSLKNYITIKDFLQSHSANEFRMFCLLTKYRSAIDYNENSMSEARVSLATVSTFCNEAQAYMKGQLQCLPVQDAVLWERLDQTKARVTTALADDFDTPQAISAIMDLVHHANCQLQPVCSSAGAVRSPAVFGATAAYIRDIFDVFGIEPSNAKEAEAMTHAGSLHAVVDQLTQFRSEVRAFALARQTATSKKAELYPDRIPLLKASDDLRNNLAPFGVLIKDRGATSTWELTKEKESQNEIQTPTENVA
ncbi:probable cysteine--tRNA ligase, mitochondrial isoform X1 [Nerophis lumbriciformis]|uniref:probable cysteine--tRNA ligase, mitochondrial isoform X1 n=1 Tax=Nerophis lumbriciformis TaxID=546530 RepID=UPI002ADF37C4|nr:probable cysteine--tRNA ligase, mitochondrial isoform X1 [Nerophis lumbriciformis]